jgi:7,8-dihydropterin-6-yl-methyl-4-(beta-D-ribofuranosyl)aminobenzene 5'-phosphate synthase
LEDTGGNFWRDKTHQQIDTLPDDQALFINTPQGIVVILGCAHAGTINTLDYIKSLTGVPGFHAVLGGMHLLRATRERIEATAKALEEHEVRLIAPNHCTGMNAIAHLWQCFPDRVVECKVGSRLEFGDRG